jgi:Ca2+-binding RTX toxin-like protein
MWTVTFGTTSGVSSTILNSIQQITFDAANYWGRYINFGSSTLEIQVNVISLGSTTLAQAGPEVFPFSRTVGGANVFQAGTILELQTGNDPNGSTHDIEIDVNLDSIQANEYFYGGLANPNVPLSQFDLFTILAHELGHGLGFISFDPVSATDDRAEYDLFKSGNFFTGPRAVALFGGNVPLQSGDGSHLNVFDLLFPSISNGERNFVSALDIAMLADAGLPILEPTAGDDSLYGFERTSGGGTLVGGNDIASLLGGNDWYDGLSGGDTIGGGPGDDTLIGGLANDSVLGGADDDLLIGFESNGTASPSAFDTDTLLGGDGNDTIFGAVNDVIDGGAGFDTLDLSSVGVGREVRVGAVFGPQQTNLNLEIMIGTNFNDSLQGLDQDILLAGGAGDDTLIGGSGDDTVRGGAGSDSLNGGVTGFDVVDYSDSPGAVRVEFSGFSESGGALAADGTYVGGIPDDLIFPDFEKIIGSNFGDRLVGKALLATEIDGGGGGDFILGGSAADTISGGGGGDTIRSGEGSDSISGGDGADVIEVSGGFDFAHGGAGNDTIFGGTSPDTINGGLGNDVLDGGTAFDTLDYSDRTDSGVNVNVINGVALTGGFINSAGFYQGGVQEDTISNFENIFGTMFRDRLIAGSTSARIEGRDGDDFLFAFSGNDTLFGGEGNDVIESNKSSDQLFGENGNDTLNGGTGLDTINGGAGTDTADYGNREGAVSVNLTTNIAVSGGALNSSGFYSGGFTEDSLVSIEAVFGSSFGDRLVAGNFASRLEGRGGNDNISGLGGADTLIGGAGNDTLGGGAGADLFEFASGFGADRITDFDEGASLSDVIRLVGLGASFDSFGEVIAAASQSGADVVFNFGGGNTITVLNATVAAFNANDFEFG